MNLELLDPFEQDFPEVIEDTLEGGLAVTVRFNRRGTLLAAGCSDGTIVVWDFDTRGVSRSLIGHVKIVTSLRDWSCIVWDLLTGTKQHTIRFDTPVLNAQFHPKNNSLFIAALHQEKPVLVDFSNGIKRSPILMDPKDEGSSEQNSNSTPTPATTVAAGQTQWTLVVTFDRQGKRIYAGSNRGQISIINTETRSLLYEIRPTTSAIKSIKFSRRGKEILVNANDRIIRLFAVREDGPPEQLHKFQDLVNRIQWNQCCFSSDADYVIGGSGHQAEHNIYIWDKIGGNLVKFLEGPKEPLEDLAWHPIRPIVASVSSYGKIHIWATNYQENWSAFAPDFKELEENIDYEEREDEFDIVPEEEASKRKHDDEDVLIDVTTIEKINPFNDSDSEDGGEETFYLPLLPSDQQPEEPQHYKHPHRHRRHHHNHHHQGHRHHRHGHGHGHGHGHQDINNSSAHAHVDVKQDTSHIHHKDEMTLDHVAEDRKRDDRDQDYDRGRDRYHDGDRDGDHDRDREHDRGEKEHKHRPDEEAFETDGGHSHGHGYENGSTNGHGYDREHSSPRRKLDDHQSSPRHVKRQR
ncbi:Retinoblastoma-binding protein 5 [Gamsiella multidivaricata]|nr:Retinoblastoma-binding protein 5 [Gamsiella multidivaricata]